MHDQGGEIRGTLDPMTDVLQRESAVPLYAQLEQILHTRITSGEWLPGQRIPSENELNRIYGLSRMTVRGVLTKLVGDGLLVRVPGKGTYVATPKINAVSPAYRGVREQLEGLGYETSTRLVSVGARDAVVRGPRTARARRGRRDVRDRPRPLGPGRADQPAPLLRAGPPGARARRARRRRQPAVRRPRGALRPAHEARPRGARGRRRDAPRTPSTWACAAASRPSSCRT